ncbi:AAA family ATPase [Streptomyces sp. NPDC060188]|uniref:AAA family ATPase n=1 Tax=Streptomyces sp. NPDC060188 TaxID=3347068 RepID=UPI003663DE90
MRLHSLTLQAFGPFAGTHTIDFESLTGEGLFLLHGATGAGKSTVFDAICYALYGKTPGDRDQLLRSDHAADHLLTEVTLDVTLSGHRLEITRSPRQQRPKARGAGYTWHNAKTLMRELEHDDTTGQDRWESASKAHDEIGDHLQALLGMSRDQFCQVVLLPQNQFTQFLRAKAPARKDLLSKLFRTSRFTDIDTWLLNHSREAEKDLKAARSDVISLVDRIHQAATGLDHESDAPATDDPQTLPDAAPTWATVLMRTAAAHLETADTQMQTAAADLTEQQAHERTVDLLHQQQTEHRTAAEQLEQLDQQAPRQQYITDQRQQARRAAKLAAVLHAAHTAADEHTRAEILERQARDTLHAPHATASAEELATAEQQTWAQATFVEALLPQEAAIRQMAQDLRQLDTERQALAADQLEAGEWLGNEPGRRAELTARLHAAQRAETDNVHQQTSLADLQRRLTAAQQRDDRLADVASREQLWEKAGKAVGEAAQAYITLRRQRTEGMAAELAADLTEGTPCPVCGSCTHPAKAAPHAGQPTREDEQKAETRHLEAEKTKEDAAAALHEARELLAQARAQAGDTPLDDIRTLLANAQTDLEATLKTASDAGPAREALAALDRDHMAMTDQATTAGEHLAARNTAYDHLATQLAELQSQLDQARQQAPSITDRLTDLHRTAGQLKTATGAATATLRLEAERTLRADEAETAAHEQNFPTARAAEKALLDDDALHTIEEEIKNFSHQRAVHTATLDRPDLAQAAAQPPADLEGARQLNKTAAQRHTDAVAATAAARTRHDQLTELTTRLTDSIQRLHPLQEAYDTVHHLHEVIHGTSTSNRDRMELEAYVLAARLEQIVDAANTRLRLMSDHRYTLAHSDDRASNGARSGLGLKITDAWTGRDRTTDTLSGGESFFASLALALGLADVVTYEAGGRVLNTLFIDEGFGTLDDDTLHHVLDVLDSLRAHDRTVGLISHVPELRRRITSQLHVRKGTDGSTLHPVSHTAE